MERTAPRLGDAPWVRQAGLGFVVAAAAGAVAGALEPIYAVALLAALGVLLWATLRPHRAIIVLPLAMYAPVRESLSESVNVTLGDLLLVVVAIGWLLWAWKRKSLLLDRDPLFAVLVLVVAAPVLSLFNTPDKGLTLFGAVRTFELWLLLFAVVLSTVRDLDAVDWLIKAFVGAAALEALVGIGQFLTATGAYVGTSYTRAYGTGNLYSWLDFATAMGLAITLLVADLLVRRRGGMWRWAALAMLVAGILATYTRGVWLAILVSVAAMALASRPRALVVLLVVVGLVLAAIAADPQSDLARRVVSVADPNDPSVVQRTYLWRTAAKMFAAHPLVGNGAKSFPQLRDRYAVPGLEIYSYHETPGESLKVELLSPHNFYLMVAAETGLVGLLAYLSVFLGLLLRGLRVQRAARSERERALALGLTGVLVFLVVHATHSDLFHGPIAIVATFLVACLAAVAQIHRRTDENGAPVPARARGAG